MADWSYLPIELQIVIPAVVVALAAILVGVIVRIVKVHRARALQAETSPKEQLYIETVEALALSINARDQTTYGHSLRVRKYALGLAKLSGITDAQELKAIEVGSLLHDIGKLSIEDCILNKPSRLSDQEFEKIKLHSTAGEKILSQIRLPNPVAKYVRWHHERWDGTGYPDGLTGEQIPIGARIISIAEAFDTMRSTCPYKASVELDESVRLLRAQAGKGYDPRLVELFVLHVAELEAAARGTDATPL